MNDNPPNRGDTVFMCGMILFRVDVGIGKDHATVMPQSCHSIYAFDSINFTFRKVCAILSTEVIPCGNKNQLFTVEICISIG